MSVISIPDMNCGHCKASVERALAALGGKVSVDLPAREVSLEGISAEAAIAALDDIGFPASVKG